MTGQDGAEFAGALGPHDPDVAATDALFDRLGRREPGPADLDDPLAASLALLAGDVDLRPVSIETTRLALISTGAGPAGDGSAPAAQAVAPTGRRGRDVSADPARTTTPIVGPRPAPEADGDRRAERRGRATKRRGVHGLLRPVAADGGTRPARRRLRRSSLGLTSAAALVVLGGTITAFVTDEGTTNPLSGLSSAVRHWGGESGEVTRASLVAKVSRARLLLREGRTGDAKALIDDVRADLDGLDVAEQRELALQLMLLEEELAYGPLVGLLPGPSASPGTRVDTPGISGRVQADQEAISSAGAGGSGKTSTTSADAGQAASGAQPSADSPSVSDDAGEADDAHDDDRNRGKGRDDREPAPAGPAGDAGPAGSPVGDQVTPTSSEPAGPSSEPAELAPAGDPAEVPASAGAPAADEAQAPDRPGSQSRSDSKRSDSKRSDSKRSDSSRPDSQDDRRDARAEEKGSRAGRAAGSG